MKVLICGHWQTGRAAVTTRDAHEALRRGIEELLPEVAVDTMVFGGGPDFCASLPRGVEGVSIPNDCTDATALGREVTCLVNRRKRVVIEGGHCASTSLWATFLEGALDMPPHSFLRSVGEGLLVDEAALMSAVDTLRKAWGQWVPSFAASTQRKLVGLSSVMAIAPDLSARSDTDPRVALALRHALATAQEVHAPRVALLGHAASDPASTPGGGAGGGVGAVIAAVGGHVRECGEFLAYERGLRTLMGDYGLLVVTEPLLHSPSLAEACLDVLTDAAAQSALPVVAVGTESSLSRHELAQWGVHGNLLSVNSTEALRCVGQRVAHTWLRRTRQG